MVFLGKIVERSGNRQCQFPRRRLIISTIILDCRGNVNGFQYMTERLLLSSLELKKKEKYKQNKTKLTVNGHLLDHKVLAGERGHDAFKVAGELDSWTDEVNGPVLGQHVVSGRCVTQADVLLHGPDGQRHLAEYPLVRWAGTVEVPCDHQTFGLARAQPVQTVQKHVGAVEHGARHSLVDYHHVVPYGCKQTRAY